MKTVTDIPAEAFIEEAARDLRENMKMEKPGWAGYVKTGVAKQRTPDNPEWWWARTASILRTISINGPVGVENLRKKHSARQNRGRRPEKRRKAGGKIIRTMLIQLDTLSLTEKTKRGRILTSKGQSYVNDICKKLSENE